MKADELLQELGLKNLNDFLTILPENIFEEMSIDTVRATLEFYNMNTKNLKNTEESKFEHVNLILMLKIGSYIDVIRNFDENDQKGFRLEKLSC